MTTSLGQTGRLDQKQTLAPQMLQGVKMLAMSLPVLRTELMAKIASNPAIEDIDHPLETLLSEVEARQKADEPMPDYPDDGYEPAASVDEEAAERRQAFFDNQVKKETLQEHLVAQFPLSDIAEADRGLAEVLVSDLDENGRYVGSLPDACMTFGKSEAEVVALLVKIMALDPPGCGARNPRECLLAQLDKLNGTGHRETVRKMVEDHFEDLAAGRLDVVEAALGITHARCLEALTALRTLEAYPGRAFPNERDRVEYVNPEVHAVCRDGYWHAVTDRRSLPKIRLSRSFLEQLRTPNLSPEDKAKMLAYVEEARALAAAIGERRNTVEAVAQAIFDRQQAFFTEGFKGLKPLTETEIAVEVGVDTSTVSRTVRDKYASTPRGTIELRRFFPTGVRKADGESVTQDAVLSKLKELIAAEDSAHPLADGVLSDRLKAAGFKVARRTVAKYRDLLGIPVASARAIVRTEVK